jgi:hypothetical protein
MNKNIKQCQKCGRLVGKNIHFCSIGAWNRGKKGLQVAWNKGKTNIYSEETIRKNREAHLGKKYPDRKSPKPFSEEHRIKIGLNGFHYGMKGKKHKTKTRELMSNAHKGEKCQWWQGGITGLYNRIRHSFKYRQWVSDIFTRDDFTCQNCGQRGGGEKHAHHIKQFALIIKENDIKSFDDAMNCSELWNLNNGITNCVDCHKKTKTYLQPMAQQMPQTSMVGGAPVNQIK